MRRYDVEMKRGKRADIIEVVADSEAAARALIAKKYEGQDPVIITIEDVTDTEGLTNLDGVLGAPGDGDVEMRTRTGEPAKAGTYEDDAG